MRQFENVKKSPLCDGLCVCEELVPNLFRGGRGMKLKNQLGITNDFVAWII
jgi:hypothetical protein